MQKTSNDVKLEVLQMMRLDVASWNEQEKLVRVLC